MTRLNTAEEDDNQSLTTTTDDSKTVWSTSSEAPLTQNAVKSKKNVLEGIKLKAADTSKPTMKQKCRALALKKLTSHRRDFKFIFVGFILPLLFFIVALVFNIIR